MPPHRSRIRPILLAGTLLASGLVAVTTVADANPYFRFNLGKNNGGIGTGGTGGTTPGGTDPGTTPGGTDPGGTPTGPDVGTNNPTDPERPTEPDQIGSLELAFNNGATPVVNQVGTSFGRIFAYYQKGSTRMTATGLPPGLFLNSDPEGGFASVDGTPTQAGRFSGTVTAVDDWGQTGSTPYTLYVSKVPGTSDPADFFVPPLDNLFIDQPSYVDVSYLPAPDGACVTYSLKSGTLPPGMQIDPRCHSYDSRLFVYDQNIPTLAGDYGNIVITATPSDGKPPIDSAPVPVKVNQPDLAANAYPLLVKTDPGVFDGRYTFRGEVSYGSQDLRGLNKLDDTNVTLNGTPPQGMTWDAGNLGFSGEPTKAGEKQTMSFTVTYKGQTKTSQPFTIQVNNAISPYTVYNECRVQPSMPDLNGGMTPGGTFCDLQEAYSNDVIPVAYMTDPYVRVLDRGGQPITVTLVPGSTLPAGLSLSSNGVIRGETSATGSYPIAFKVSASGFPDRLQGPYTLEVGGPDTKVDMPPNWFIPEVVSVVVPYVQGESQICNNPFPESEGPYSNVTASGMTGHMTVQPDGTFCSTGYSSPRATWDGETHQSSGTVTATKKDGSTYSKSVTFYETPKPN